VVSRSRRNSQADCKAGPGPEGNVAGPGTVARPPGSGMAGFGRDGDAPSSWTGDGHQLADPEADPEATARQICLKMLTAAPRTRAQLAAALSRRGVPDEVAEAVLGRFAEVKLIDDAMFASAWVESRHHGRGLAGRALAAELRQRGVASGDIEAAISELKPEREIATARSLVARRLSATRGQPLQARIRRLMGVLARKGYPQALAYRIVREALEQEGIDPAATGLGLENPPEDDPDEGAPGW
jgi:regulatory protein